MSQAFEQALDRMPIIAILRGVTPDEILPIAKVLLKAGIQIIEVPLNSPDACESIKLLANNLTDRAVYGAGTVVTLEDAVNATKAGAQIIVSPNTNPDVIKYSIQHNAIPVPGFSTPTEAFTAIQSGARFLKLFPAESYHPTHIKALKAVLPEYVRILAVGGTHEGNFKEWQAHGADGFGIGSNLYVRGASVEVTAQRASKLINALKH